MSLFSSIISAQMLLLSVIFHTSISFIKKNQLNSTASILILLAYEIFIMSSLNLKVLVGILNVQGLILSNTVFIKVRCMVLGEVQRHI